MQRMGVVFCATLALFAALCAAQREFDCADGDLRLVGGGEEYEGRVEICLYGEWGTVCDDIWDSSNAEVVCNQLGFNFSAAIPTTRAFYGQGSGPIFLDNVDCLGAEERLFDCVHRGAGIHNCGHNEDAGVYCQPMDEACADGAIRLAGVREVENEGRVELCHRGQWGTVCDDRWDRVDATVACVQLGYPAHGAVAVSRATYGQGIGDILYDEVDCNGEERNLTDCQSDGLRVHNCLHSEDAGVLCSPLEDTLCHNGELRLAGGRDSTEGRVEICYNGRWGTVCDDLFDERDARVICRQLGFPTDLAYSQAWATFGEGTGPIFLDNLDCIGNETSLLSCRHDGVSFHNCRHNEDVSVICLAKEERCRAGDVRLIGGDFPNEGRVEVCVNNHWGTICSEGFDTRDARVVCNQLQHTNGEAISVEDGYFGAGLGMIWMNGLQCLGNESSLFECSRHALSPTCSHSRDVSVICPVGEGVGRCRDGEVRLVNGLVPNEGVVEICYNGRWGAICDDHWDILDATVVCNQLGFYGDSVIVVVNGAFSSSSGPILLDSVDCWGNESRLEQCFNRSSLGDHNCRGSTGHAGVLCPATDRLCENGEVRLVYGGTLLEGQVELCYNSRWGTVCDSMWDNRDAGVVCRQITAEYGLDYDDLLNPVAVVGSAFGGGVGPVFLRNLHCVGSEESLLECRGGQVGVYDCSDHRHDAGVYCGLQPCKEGSLRLTGGLSNSNNTGRVEMCVHSVWAGLCDRDFDQKSAQLVCSLLGLPARDAVLVRGDLFGYGHHITSWAVVYSCDDTATHCTLTPSSREKCPNIGVFCEQMSTNTDEPMTVCTTGQVRLVGGANSSEGRVETCLNGHWGKICDDSWDDNAAKVVCGQLKLPTLGARAVMSSYWGASPSLDYMLDDIKCFGNESALLNCHSSPILSHNCLHSEEAGVTCHGKAQKSDSTNSPPPTAVAAGLGSSDGGTEREREGGGGEMYTSGQVAAIILPVLVVMMIIMATSLAGMWLALQRRKRVVNQSDHFPIIPGQGIVQFNEFSSESSSLDKIPGCTTTL